MKTYLKGKSIILTKKDLPGTDHHGRKTETKVVDPGLSLVVSGTGF
jgi:hypothetical protein